MRGQPYLKAITKKSCWMIQGHRTRFVAGFSWQSIKHSRPPHYIDPEQLQIDKENASWRKRSKRELDSEAFPPALHVVCRKEKGQHLLKNFHIVEAIVDKAGICSTDTVLEIGPGTGNLTLRLLQAARKVIAIELDPRMIEELQRRAQLTDYADKLELIRGNIMDMELPKFDLCVANIPYKISSPLMFKLLNCTSKFRVAVLMLQKEFAKRLMASPGNPLFCRLSVNTQLLARVDILMEVGKANFSPPPKVDSCVVCLSPRPWPPPVNLKEWNHFIRICFSRKNKTLGAIFRQKYILNKLAASQNCCDLDGSSLEEESACVSESEFELSEDDTTVNVSSEDDVSSLDIRNETVSEEDIIKFKNKVIDTLCEEGFQDKRAVKLTQQEFVALLSAFNRAGIKFA